MIYVNANNFIGGPLVPGKTRDIVDRFFQSFGQARATDNRSLTQSRAASVNPLKARLRYIQDRISEVSMHLPQGFAIGLNRQFANLMDCDAWEDDDALISPDALTAFLNTLLYSKTLRRPGIGTNGQGSITASWTVGANRLTIECLPSGLASLVLSRSGKNGEVERAAFAPMRPARIPEVLVPFDPEVWFDR